VLRVCSAASSVFRLLFSLQQSSDVPCFHLAISLSHFLQPRTVTPSSVQLSGLSSCASPAPLYYKKAAHPALTFFPQPHTRLPSQLHTQLFTRLIPSTSSITHSFYSFAPLIYTTYFLHHSPSTLAFDIGLRHWPSTPPHSFDLSFRPQHPTSTSTSTSTTLLTMCIKHYQQSLLARIILLFEHVCYQFLTTSVEACPCQASGCRHLQLLSTNIFFRTHMLTQPDSYISYHRCLSITRLVATSSSLLTPATTLPVTVFSFLVLFVTAIHFPPLAHPFLSSADSSCFPSTFPLGGTNCPLRRTGKNIRRVSPVGAGQGAHIIQISCI
jgi:hypothetical protein